MPKRGHDYPAQLSFGVPADARVMLRALAYLRGGAEYADQARLAIKLGLEAILQGLTERERGQLARILESVKLQEATLKDIRENKPRQVRTRIGTGQ